MLAPSRPTLELRDGAQEFDLPEGAKDLSSKLLEAVKNISPEVTEIEGKRIYRYKKLPECQEFSIFVIHNKARDILDQLSSAGWTPNLAEKPFVPEIVGCDETTALTSDDCVAVIALITGPVKIEIHAASKTLSHLWEPGKILVLMPKTHLKFDFKGENHDASMGDKEKQKRNVETGDRVEYGKERACIFYTMFPVKKSR